MLRETCLLLSKKNSKTSYNDFLSLFMELMKKKFEMLKKENNYINTSLVINHLLFIFTLAINLREYPAFIKILFKKYFKPILNLIKEIKNTKTNKILLELLSGLFAEDYKTIFFRKDKEKDKDLEELYESKEIELKKVYDYKANNHYTKEVYEKIFQILFDFDINYEKIYTNYSIKISRENIPIFKINLIQSILRLLFYPGKNRYYSKNKYYEYDLLKK